MNVQLSPLSSHPAATMPPLPQFFYINIHIISYLEPEGAFHFLSATHPWVRICRHSWQQGLACKTIAFQKYLEKRDRNRHSAQFAFIFAGPLLCSWSIREKTETEDTHTFNPCSKDLPTSVHAAGSYPVPHEGHPFIQSQELDTEKANAWLLTEPQTFFLNIQTLLLSHLCA